jgi:hypothetical protein
MRWMAMIAAGLIWVTAASATEVHHDLHVTLQPKDGSIIGQDRIRVEPGGDAVIDIFLAAHASNLTVRKNEQPAAFQREGSRIRLPLDAEERAAPFFLTVSYAAVFRDPVPNRPVNTDNPGYGVSGTISDKGTLLLAGSGWYPHVAAANATYRIRVAAPAGILAVTAGRSLGHRLENGTSLSEWQVDHPVRGLSLSAGRYEVQQRTVAGVSVATYLFPASRDLAETYLENSARYLELYSDRFGPYPFDKFAVVENFFPTGYGFASYTLIGSRVLRLPFIVHTSLGHEIAHCWWGNAVYVDYRTGNWSEGLTTYTADYLYQEMISEAAAQQYRRQMLRNYASLVKPADDFPLSRFQSRTDPASKAIGYDKAAMVFHMLRRMTGDEGFWTVLQDVYRGRKFEAISWKDWQQVFERQSGRDLSTFFEQWIFRSGAPVLRLEVQSSDVRGNVQGRLLQERPFFALQVPLRLQGAQGSRETTVAASGRETEFAIGSNGPSRVLEADPEFDVFRRLHPSEIPPSVNSLRGAASVRVLLAEGLSSQARQAAATLAAGLGLDSPEMVEAGEVDLQSLKNSDLLLVGVPGDPGLLSTAQQRGQFSADDFRLAADFGNPGGNAFFGVFPHPLRSDGVVALFLPLSAAHAEAVARKVPHYGKYSYLVFEDQTNRAKGVWPVQSSPLIYRWENRKES